VQAEKENNMTIDEMKEILEKGNQANYDNSDFYYPPVDGAEMEYIALSVKEDAELSECMIIEIHEGKGTNWKDTLWTVYSDNSQKVIYVDNFSKINYFLQKFSHVESLAEKRKRFYEEKNKYSIYKHAIYLQKLLKTAEATAINSQYDKYVNKKYPFSGEEMYNFKILNKENKKIYDCRTELGLSFHEFKQLLNS